MTRKLALITPLAIATLSIVVLAGCYNHKADKLVPSKTTTCDTTSISYTKDIVPIINSSCAISGGCHDAAGVPTSGYDFTIYATLASVASDGSLVGDITWNPTPRHNNMPKDAAKLPDCDINKFIKWVNEGYPNN